MPTEEYMPKKKVYDNDSISSLKGADRVRKRPGVIFATNPVGNTCFAAS